MKPVREITATQTDSSFAAFRTQFAPKTFWHYHPEFEFLLVLRGSGMQFIGDTTTRFDEGDLVFIGPALPHAWQEDARFRESRKHASALVIQFGRDFMGADFFDKPELRRVAALLEKARSGLKIVGHTRESASRELLSLLRQTGLRSLLTLLEILEEIAASTEVVPFCAPGFRSDFTEKDLGRVDQICTYLHQNCGKTIRLPEVAKHFHMAPRTLARFMKRNTGKTLIQFVNALRVNLACQLLLQGDLTISQVSYECGFSDPSYFDRKFREIKGMLPREFRGRFSPRGAVSGQTG